MVGFTRDIPFSPMEVKASTRLGAAQADDAEVDLLAWALPDETNKQANARNVLWHLAVMVGPQYCKRSIQLVASEWKGP